LRRWLSEIDSSLLLLPVAPTTDEDLLERAALMRRRLELVSAGRPDLRTPPDPAGMVEVFVPEGGAGCVMSRTLCNRFYYASEEDDGRFIIKMPWSEFYALALVIQVQVQDPTAAPG